VTAYTSACAAFTSSSTSPPSAAYPNCTIFVPACTNREAVREPRAGQPGQTAARDENPKQREPRDAREPRRQRGEPRPERKDQAVIVPLAEENIGIAANPETAERLAEEGNGSASRRRGRRGGRRDRGERSENQPDVPTGEAILPVAAAEGVVVAMVTPAPAEMDADGRASAPLVAIKERAEAIAQPLVAAAPEPAPEPVYAEASANAVATDAEIETATAQIVSAPVVAESLAPVETVEAAAAEPMGEPVTAVAPQIVAVEPFIDIEEALQTSGLVMVETSGDKVRSWQPEVVTSEVAHRPRRKPPVAVAAQEEPLVMVETNRSA
jgi:ribonuclease E